MLEIQKAMKKEMQEKYFTPNGLFEVSEKIPFVPVGYKRKKTNKSRLPCSEDSIKDLAKKMPSPM